MATATKGGAGAPPVGGPAPITAVPVLPVSILPGVGGKEDRPGQVNPLQAELDGLRRHMEGMRRLVSGIARQATPEEAKYLGERGWSDDGERGWYDSQPPGDRKESVREPIYDRVPDSQPLERTIAGAQPWWYSLDEALRLERLRDRQPLPKYTIVQDSVTHRGGESGIVVFWNVLDRCKRVVAHRLRDEEAAREWIARHGGGDA